MKLGIDLDNTIIDYSQAFAKRAHVLGVHCEDPALVRSSLRKHLFAQPGGNVAWTRLQAEIYSTGLVDAVPFSGVIRCLEKLKALKIPVCIISHKTRYPALGKAVSFHQLARDWLSTQGLLDLVDDVFFEVTVSDKLWRVAEQNCTHFVDDLPSILEHAEFPQHVNGLLFDSTLRKKETLNQAFPRWEAIEKYLLTEHEGSASTRLPLNADGAETLSLEQRLAGVEALLSGSGFGSVSERERLSGSGNNAVYRLQLAGGQQLVAKIYKKEPDDRRDRLNHEWSFLSLIHGKTDFEVPKPLLRSDGLSVGIYSLLEGDAIAFGSPAVKADGMQCLEFLRQLQSLKGATLANELPSASEACWSLQDYWGSVHLRRDMWLEKATSGVLDAVSADWIQSDLEAVFQALAEASIGDPLFKEQLPRDASILSPSDFGLHNALRQKNGRLAFVDFEYAGWDNPCKTICDFLWQPRIPFAEESFERFKQCFYHEVSTEIKDFFPEDYLRLFEQVTQLKWCYLMLQHQGVSDAAKERIEGLYACLSAAV